MADNGITARATAYLKPDVPADDPAPALELSQADSPVLRPLGAGLLVAYLVDEGSAFCYVQNRHLEAEAVSKDQLHRIGLDNLQQLAYSGKLQVFPHPRGTMFAAMMGGNFEASLILVDELWEQSFRQFVQGEYAVAIPARDVLAFCGSASAEGLAELQQIIKRVFPIADHALSDKVFVRHSGQWIPA